MFFLLLYCVLSTYIVYEYKLCATTNTKYHGVVLYCSVLLVLVVIIIVH